MIDRKDIIKIFLTLFTLIGATAGVVLTHRSQDMRSKAEMTCNYSNNGLCGIGTGCPQGYMCSQGRCIKHSACNYPYCPATNCNIPTTLPEAVYCILRTNGRLTTCCPVDKPLYDNGKCVQTGSSGGGSGSGGECSRASATNCQGKNPGDACGSGKKCQKTSQNGSDGKPKCSCTASGGGGGGGESCDKNPNPTILDITSDGELAISFASFLESTPPKIALKKNSQTCSLTEYDKIIDTKDITSNQPTKTGIILKNGDRLCVYGEDVGSDAGPYPFEGWIESTDNKCKNKDISPLIQAIEAEKATILSKQCWGDYAKKPDCDFNDYAIIISLYSTPSTPSPTEKIKILFRQQGIVSKVISNIPYQLNTYISLKNDNNSYTIEKTTPYINDYGVWTISFSTDDQGNSIPNGTYSLFIKGISHLKKRFDKVEIEGDTVTIDKSIDAKDELKAGDVNNDNTISIEDISQVLRFYTDFNVKVNSLDKNMVGADVNKDGYITIDDVALVALNWSSFIVRGD